MEYAEYKSILDAALTDYINNGGSVFYMADAVKEYIFDYDNETMPYGTRNRLEDKAVEAIVEKKKLPDGVRLVKCIWHGRTGNEERKI